MSRFLQHIYVERYGGLADREIGPFGPGLNVVYGPNEAGKSTIASLVGGVLFGWEDAHGVRNTYRPDRAGESGRSGRLSWSDGESPSVWFARDEGGASGDASVIDDIDQGTFDAVFSLNAEELRSLKGSSDVTAQLLTAGSGTASSPAATFVEIERRIANTPVYRLESELEEKREQVKTATEQVKLQIQKDRERNDLEASRAVATNRLSELDDELSELISLRSELEAADARSEQLGEELAGLRAELATVSESRAGKGAIDARLLELDSAADRVMRDRLDELAEEREKLGRAVDIAKENSSTSSAAYEALCELDEDEVAERRRLRNRPWQALVAVFLPIAFIAAGIPLFVHGRQINSLSFTALGVGLVVFAVFLAAAAFFLLFRQPAGGEALEGRRKDAQWVMLQDRKKLDACVADQEEFEQRVTAIFDDAGLAAAEGSIRQARTLLDEARDMRVARAEDGQRATALELRIRACEQELDELRATRERIDAAVRGARAWTGAAGRSEGARARETARAEGERKLASALAHEVELLVGEKVEQREALVEAVSGMSQRFGELTHELEAARSDRELDQVKFEYQQLRARLREAKHELVCLLLARRMLERSITAWESQSQPEVHALAGRLLAMITDGRWVQVATSPTGSLVAVGADGVARDPRHLSLGTCQQLYLALRIALLVTADEVGRAIPVIADDILVNFDAMRRRGAARALAVLARSRQVIVFTCHEETAAALREAAPDAVRLDLR